jgi:hypothetical protein
MFCWKSLTCSLKAQWLIDIFIILSSTLFRTSGFIYITYIDTSHVLWSSLLLESLLCSLKGYIGSFNLLIFNSVSPRPWTNILFILFKPWFITSKFSFSFCNLITIRNISLYLRGLISSRTSWYRIVTIYLSLIPISSRGKRYFLLRF